VSEADTTGGTGGGLGYITEEPTEFSEEQAMVLSEAERRLRSAGLLVRRTDGVNLHMATGYAQHGEYRVGLYENASVLIANGDGQYTAGFPTIAAAVVNVTGSLDELVPLIERVYKHCETLNQPLHESVRELVLGVSNWADAAPLLKRQRAAGVPSSTS
jgi:hypothetical protein